MTSQVTLNGETFIEPTDFENYGFRVKFFSLIRAWLADAGKAMVTTSASSLAIATGSKDFILAEDRPFASGAWITATDSANSANYMFGQVTGYVAGTKTLTVNVTAIGGSGTKTAWNIQLSGLRGAAGADGTNGTNGTNGTFSASDRAGMLAEATILAML